MGVDLGWKDLDTFCEEDRRNALTLIENFIRSHANANMDHDPDWLFAKCGPGKSVKIFIYFSPEGNIIGYAPFFLHPSALSFGLFGLSFLDYRICRYSITAEPLLAVEHTELQTLLKNLFETIRSLLGQRDVLFGLGVELESGFGQFLTTNSDVKKKYQILPSGAPYQRRLIQLPADIETYISGLGYSTRYEVRRALRRLKDKAVVSFRVYSNPDDVTELVRQLQSVSVKTYQHTLLNLGISENEENLRIFRYAANKGWLRSFILSCNDEPVAFEHGFLYNGTYYLTHMGYDPAWAKSSVGTVSHIYAVEDLIKIDTKAFDFLYGDNGSKERLSNISREEQNFYLIPRKFPLSIISHTLRLFNSTVALAGKFMEKYDIKSRVRRFLRRRSTRS